MRALLVAAALAIAVAASALVDAAQSSSGKERRFFSARQGVGVEAPPGWTLSQHTGYPTVLVALVHPGGSRISLAVDRTTAKDASALVEQSKPGLLAQGLTIERVRARPARRRAAGSAGRAAATKRSASSTSCAKSRAAATNARRSW